METERTAEKMILKKHVFFGCCVFTPSGFFLFVIHTPWNDSALMFVDCKTPLDELGFMIYVLVQEFFGSPVLGLAKQSHSTP